MTIQWPVKYIFCSLLAQVGTDIRETLTFMRPRSPRLYSLMFALMFVSTTALPPGAESQSRNLPRAGFPVIRRPQQAGEPDSLPASMGVHLTPGYDRTPSNAAVPYNPGEPTLKMSLVRWEPKKMPLKIWISPGLKLPEVPFNELQNTRVDMVFEMLRSETPFLGVGQAPGWVEETNYQVAAGIERWRQFESEGLFSFGFVEDPRDAHILVFFTDMFKDAGGPGGINVGGVTSAQVYPLSQAQQIKIAQKPVIIELALSINHTPERLLGATAHEFGHALGIKAHSPYRDDIMYVDRVVDQLSPADKATIRKLYQSTPGYVM